MRTVIVHIIATMAGNLDCPDTVKALSNQDVNKLSNTQLKKALNTILPILNTEVPSEMNSNDLLKTLINNQEKHFEVMINTMRETTSLNQSRLDSEIFDLNKRCDSNEKRIKDLTDKLEQSENKVIVLENELGKCYKEIDELETYQRRPCLVVNNLKTEPSMTDERSQPRASLSSLEMSLSFSNGAARPNLYGEVLGWWVFKNYRYFVLPLPAGVGITIRT